MSGNKHSEVRGAEWEEARQTALSRDDHECQFCGITNHQHQQDHDQELHIHHIIPRSEGGTNHPDNLISVCRSCHRTMEGTQAKALARMKKQIPQRDDLKEGFRLLQEEIQELNTGPQVDDDEIYRPPDRWELDVYVVTGSRGMSNRTFTVTTKRKTAVRTFSETDAGQKKIEEHRISVPSDALETPPSYSPGEETADD